MAVLAINIANNLNEHFYGGFKHQKKLSTLMCFSTPQECNENPLIVNSTDGNKSSILFSDIIKMSIRSYRR